jgi:hypothetical protein
MFIDMPDSGPSGDVQKSITSAAMSESGVKASGK